MGKARMSIVSVAAMGVGAMVGAGIFSLMGQAALMAGKYVYASYLLGGIVALLSGITYARLGSRYPSAGGILTYFDKGFGTGTASGALGLIYFATLAVTVAMVAQAFGAYAAALLHMAGLYLPKAFLSGFIIIALGLLNIQGSGAVGRAEIVLVAIKLTILLLLVAAGMPGVAPASLHHTLDHLSLTDFCGSVGLCFFAYAGYGMMANAAPDLSNPRRMLPHAIVLSIGAVTLLYVLLALVITDKISPEQLAAHADTAIAAAAAPVLGNIGCIFVSVAALVATASAANATLFSMLRIMDTLARRGELSSRLAVRIWKNGSSGFGCVLLICLLMAVLMRLGQTANIAGGTFLISYMAVYVAHWRLRRETRTPGWQIIPGAVLMLVIFVGYMVSLYEKTPRIPALIALIVVASFLAEKIMRRFDKNSKN